MPRGLRGGRRNIIQVGEYFPLHFYTVEKLHTVQGVGRIKGKQVHHFLPLRLLTMVRRKSSSPKRASEATRKKVEKCRILVGNRSAKISRKVMDEVKRMQLTVEHCIPKLPFARLVREIMQNEARSRDYKIQSLALKALQETAELYVTHYFEDSYKCSFHAGRITLMARDMQLVKEMRSRYEPNMQSP